MNALSRNMLRALRSYDLDGVLACDFRTVKALLAAGFITWNSTRSCYEPNALGLQALVDHEEANQPDPDLLGWLIDAVQAPEDADDEPDPAQAEPVVDVEVVTAELVEPSDPALLAQMLAPGFTLDRLALPPAQPEPAAEPAPSKPKRRRARRAVTA